MTNLIESGNMHSILIVIVAILPSVFLAYKSKSGGHAGLFVLYVWIVGSCLAVLLGVIYFLVFLTSILITAFQFKNNLDFQRWVKRGKNKP